MESIIRNLKKREYIVAVREDAQPGIASLNKEFKIIKNRLNSWAADPFPFEYKGELYIFAELYQYSNRKGSIGYTKKTKNGFSPWKIIISEPYHLSFPNTFERNGRIYMCPEAHESGQLYLYQCVDFPDKWVKCAPIAKGDFNDTIFYSKSEMLYALTYHFQKQDHRYGIYQLTDNTLIPMSSVCSLSDDYCRPAGNIFYDLCEKKEVLVSQIGVPKYGSGILLKEFSVDWPLYREQVLAKKYPQDIKCDMKKEYEGIHTFNVSEHYAVIDLVWSRISVIETFYRFVRKIKKLFSKFRGLFYGHKKRVDS